MPLAAPGAALVSPSTNQIQIQYDWSLGALWTLSRGSLWHRPAGLIEDSLPDPRPPPGIDPFRLGAQALVQNQRFAHVVSPSTYCVAQQRHGHERLVKVAATQSARQSAESLSSFSSSLSRNSGSFAVSPVFFAGLESLKASLTQSERIFIYLAMFMI